MLVDEAVPVLELLGVPVRVLEEVPVIVLLGVLVLELEAVPVLVLEAVPVLELLAVPVVELLAVPVCVLLDVAVALDEDVAVLLGEAVAVTDMLLKLVSELLGVFVELGDTELVLEVLLVIEGDGVDDVLRMVAMLRPRKVMADMAASASPASQSVDS